MKKIGIIVNPNAKRIRKMKTSPAETFRAIAGDYADIRETACVEDVQNIIKIFKDEKIPYIGICGGDGTIHGVVTDIVNVYDRDEIPPILILKCGTMNNVARTAGLKGSGPAALKRLVSAFKTDTAIRTVTRDTMKIGDKYCFLFGAGFTTNFLDAAYSGTEKGVVQNLKVIKRAITDSFKEVKADSMFNGLDAEIFCDGEILPFRNVTGILTGTVEHVGMGFSPMPDSIKEEGSFQAIICGMSPRDIVKNLFKLKSGKPIKNSLHINTLMSKLKIHNSVPFRYTMDGDLYDSSPELSVETGPAVRLIEV